MTRPRKDSLLERAAMRWWRSTPPNYLKFINALSAACARHAVAKKWNEKKP